MKKQLFLILFFACAYSISLNAMEKEHLDIIPLKKAESNQLCDTLDKKLDTLKEFISMSFDMRKYFSLSSCSHGAIVMFILLVNLSYFLNCNDIITNYLCSKNKWVGAVFINLFSVLFLTTSTILHGWTLFKTIPSLADDYEKEIQQLEHKIS